MKKLLLLWVLLLPVSAFGASENLDEIDARKARQDVNTYTKETLEDPATLVWNPETLCYTDIITGTEVWRLTSTSGTENSLPDITWAQFSANGERFAFGSKRDTSATASSWETERGAFMLMRSDGSYLRPANNSPSETITRHRYVHWSPVLPDVYYSPGSNYGAEGLSDKDIYKVTVSDESLTKEVMFSLTGASGECSAKKAISGDGTKYLLQCGGLFYPATVYPAASIDDSDGYAMYPTLDDYWGNTPSAAYWYHDQFLKGSDSDYWLYFIPEGDSSWWRQRLTGSATDGGPEHVIDNASPYDWGDEVEPYLTGSYNGGVCNASYRSPWCCDGDGATDCDRYLSHNSYDQWGRLTAGVNSQQAQAWGVWDGVNHVWIDSSISAPSYNWHTDWAAWSDYFAASQNDTGGTIQAVKYDGTDTLTIAYTHFRENGSTAYDSLPRVTQSPDSTKLVFHSDFLNEDANEWDLFYTVAYYPYPPEIISAAGGVVRFDWRTDQATSRGYTQRGWPDESTDDPPPPRETEKFRLWKQASCSGDWSPVATINANIFTKYNFSDGTWSGDKYWDITDPNPSGSDCYAVTAVEWSGLESRVKSNVFSDATDAETISYPTDPGADTGIISTHNADVVRYYNVYAEDGATPDISQQNRIASIPVNNGESWVDWLGNTSGTTQYVVTAVDTQGNESGALSASASHQLAPANAVGQYTLTWDLQVEAPVPPLQFNQAGQVYFNQAGQVNFNQ